MKQKKSEKKWMILRNKMANCEGATEIWPRCTNHTLNTPGMDNPKLDLERKENAEMRLIKEC